MLSIESKLSWSRKFLPLLLTNIAEQLNSKQMIRPNMAAQIKCYLMRNGLIVLFSEAKLELSCSTAISLFAFALQKHEEGLTDGRFIESDDPWILDP